MKTVESECKPTGFGPPKLTFKKYTLTSVVLFVSMSSTQGAFLKVVKNWGASNGMVNIAEVHG